MKTIQQNRSKTPIFHWFVFLFLSAGFSYFQESLSIGKPFAVEHVHYLSKIPGSTKHIAEYSVSSQKSFTLRNRSILYLKIAFLSQTMNRLVKVAIRNQATVSAFLPQNKILYFQHRTLCSGDEDFLS